MINEQELIISNKSYTNKDFEAIYTELLELATKISNRYDPTTSNESDPFIVLLKLMAFVGDKTNYNVDKNILERFLVSATQDKSVRELCDELGYHVGYYHSSTTSVTFSYNFSDSDSETSIIEIPQYSIVKDATGEIQFVTLERATIAKDSTTGYTSNEVEVIQGVLKTLYILNSDTVYLNNLDDNNRLYLPEVMIADNGVIIKGGKTDKEFWTSVDNLNTQEYLDACFKFDFDSRRGLPYIEFPEYIADIIGDGLNIDYIVTSGENGNIKSRTLTTVQTRDSSKFTIVGTDTEIPSEDIKVINANAALNGKNPETINQIYNGFKKTIGTFETLVTCRDYANYIYKNLFDENGNYLVSNVQVGDRRTDINYGCNVITYNQYGRQKQSFPEDDITAFDLCLYPFRPIQDFSFSSYNKSTGYNDSFERLENITEIKRQLEEDDDSLGTISHNFKDLKDEDIFAIKNKFKLNAIISTNKKVNDFERIEILTKVNDALARDYNSRELDFGYEIPYDSLLKTIENADSRIKSVSLYEPIQTPYIYKANGDEFAIGNADVSGLYKEIVVKNVLAGKVELYDYDTRFDFDFGQASTGICEGLSTVSTYSHIGNIPATNDGYKLNKNEVIQFVAPNFISSVIYPYGVEYQLTLIGGRTQIDANVDYELKTGESCVFRYKENSTDSQFVYKTYSTGDILRPNFDFKVDGYGASHNYTEGVTTYTMYMLQTNQEVAIRKVSEDVLDKTLQCYWFLNNENNQIPWINNEYMLEDGEYFFYSGFNFDSLYAYGSGTKLVRTNSSMLNEKLEKISDLSSLIEDGLSNFKQYFKVQMFDSTNKLTLTEQRIVTLEEDDSVRTLESESQSIIDNEFSDVSKIEYKFKDDEWTALDDISVSNYSWKARPLLLINCGPNMSQTLVANQVVVFNEGISGETIISSTGTSTFELSYLIQKIFGVKVDIKQYSLIDKDYIYNPDLIFYQKLELTSDLLPIDDEVSRVITFNSAISLSPSIIIPEKTYGMIYVYNKTGNDTISVSNMKNILTDSQLSTLDNGLYMVEYDSNSSITVTSQDENVVVIISKPRISKGINPLLGVDNSDNSFLTYFYSLPQTENFFMTNKISKDDEIELSEDYPLNSAHAFYDYNNIANKWTICEIDFENSKISVAKSSYK